MQQTRRRIPLNTIIKLGFALIFVVAIGYRLVVGEDIAALWQEFLAHWSLDRTWMILLVLILMPVNWLLETLKWSLLLRPSYRLPLKQGIRAIASGIALSLFTPNRIGEYGGRILYVPSQYNWRAVVATLIGSLGQNTVHITIGLMAALCFATATTDSPLGFSDWYWVAATGVLIGLFVLYFTLPAIARRLTRLTPPSWLSRPWRGLGHLEQIKRNELASALGISLLRYVVFSGQFVLLLLYFDVSVPVEWLAAGVATLYLMQTSIPLPPFMDVVARSELALLLWANYDVNELTVLAASFSIWIINLLIPAFFGLHAISKVNVLESLGYENQKAAQSPPVDTDDPVDRVSAGR